MSGALERWVQEDLGRLEAAGLVRTLEPLGSAQGPFVAVGGTVLLNACSNDYLGLAADAAVRAAARAALDTFGLGAGASRVVSGDTSLHQALEAALADFEGVEAAVLFGSGYGANTGVVPVLVGEGDVVFSDAWNHASLVDGCRLSRAQVVVFPHSDVAALAALVAAHPGRRRLVVTDTVFSMDGDRARLPELAALCRAEGLGLLVDEAHATGVLGATGRGACEAAGVRPDVLVGTLSKALGAAGAYVAGSAALKALVLSRARSLLFSTALPAAVYAGALAALTRVRTDPSLRARLWVNVRAFAAGLRALGLPAHEDSAIFSIVLGAPEAAVAAAAALRERGVLVKAIRPPTVPEGTSRLRVALSAAHQPQHVAALLEALAAVLGPAQAPDDSPPLGPAHSVRPETASSQGAATAALSWLPTSVHSETSCSLRAAPGAMKRQLIRSPRAAVEGPHCPQPSDSAAVEVDISEQRSEAQSRGQAQDSSHLETGLSVHAERNGVESTGQGQGLDLRLLAQPDRRPERGERRAGGEGPSPAGSR